MTIRHGEVIKAEGIDNTIDSLKITATELLPFLSAEQQDEMLMLYNEDTDESVDTPQELPAAEIMGYIEAIGYDFCESEAQVVAGVLDNRSIEYVHLYDGMIHTVIQLHHE